MRQRLPEKRLEGDFIAVLIAFEIRKPPIPEAAFGLPANEAEPEGNLAMPKPGGFAGKRGYLKIVCPSSADEA